MPTQETLKRVKEGNVTLQELRDIVEEVNDGYTELYRDWVTELTEAEAKGLLIFEWLRRQVLRQVDEQQ